MDFRASAISPMCTVGIGTIKHPESPVIGMPQQGNALVFLLPGKEGSAVLQPIPRFQIQPGRDSVPFSPGLQPVKDQRT